LQASILNLAAISLDRYVHIKDPLRYGQWVNKKSILGVIAIVWILAALISFVPISLGLHRGEEPSVEDRQPAPALPTCVLELSPTYAVVSSLVSFYLPCFIMVGIYCRLYLYARKHVKNIKAVTRPTPRTGDGRPSTQHSNSSYQVRRDSFALFTRTHQYTLNLLLKSNYHRSILNEEITICFQVSDHKAAVTVGIIMGVFLVCWVPFFCANIIAAFCKTCIPDLAFKVRRNYLPFLLPDGN